MKKQFLMLALVALFTANSVPGHASSPGNCPPEGCGTFSLGGDWLYWKTEEAKLEYGSSIEQTITGQKTERAATVLKPKFEYDSGFRVFADYTTCNDLWNFYTAYTYMPSQASNHFASTSIGTNYVSLLNVNFNLPLLNVISTTQYLYSSIDSKWNSNVNYWDFDVSRKFHLCNGFEINPYFGIRALWTHQTLRLSGAANDLLVQNDISFNSKLTSSLSSVGALGGLDISWKFCKNFSFIGHVGGAVLYANFDTKGQLNVFYNDGSSLDLHFKDPSHNGIPMFDAFFGLVYENCFCNTHWNIHVGWEEHIIFDTNALSINGSGNTTLQGLTLGAALFY